MIGSLRGIITEIEGGTVTLEVSGVGYEVQVPKTTLAQLPGINIEVTLLVRQIFREDGVSLYGFFDRFQRRMFDYLLEVKGCGPKVGLSILSTIDAEAIASAIVDGDPAVLALAPGVGPRLAERIVLELKTKAQEEVSALKIQSHTVAASSFKVKNDELVDALVGLGYKRFEAETAANEVRDRTDLVEDQLRLALQKLRKL